MIYKYMKVHSTQQMLIYIVVDVISIISSYYFKYLIKLTFVSTLPSTTCRQIPTFVINKYKNNISIQSNDISIWLNDIH